MVVMNVNILVPVYIGAHSIAAADSLFDSCARFAKTSKGQQSVTPNFTRMSVFQFA